MTEKKANPIYSLVLAGEFTIEQQKEIESCLSRDLELFDLTLGQDVDWCVGPDFFVPCQRTPTAIAFFCINKNCSTSSISSAIASDVPIIPVVNDTESFNVIPNGISQYNGIKYSSSGENVAFSLLECIGLLPTQRRVFVSYRRTEARESAVQLYEELSSKHYTVFLDTYCIGPAEDFQMALWHNLSDSDVLVMLDTPTYFDSRWTSAEFGRAQAKGIPILRIGWPSCEPSPRISTSTRIDLAPEDIDITNGRLTSAERLQEICSKIERLRSQSHAIRKANLYSQIESSLAKIGGILLGVGCGGVVHATLAGGQKIALYPSVCVPTSMTMYEAVLANPGEKLAVVYDTVGIHKKWTGHINWLNHNIPYKYVAAHSLAWEMADWGD